MSDDYTGFTADLNGDGVEDPAAIYTLDDGSNVLVGDTDGDGVADFAALDANGDGVYEQSYDANTGEYADLTGAEDYAADPADYATEYDGSGGNLDGDVAAQETEDAEYDGSGGNLDGDVAAGESGGYYDPAAVSDMLATQHETSMAIINNI